MTMPAYNSFQLYKGDTLKFTLSLKTSGSAVSLPTGTEFAGSVKEKGTSNVTANFSTNIISSASGVVLFTLPSPQSSLLDAKKNWVYDAQVTDVNGNVTTLLTGSIFVTDQVTL
jgi:hypothetical protein